MGVYEPEPLLLCPANEEAQNSFARTVLGTVVLPVLPKTVLVVSRFLE